MKYGNSATVKRTLLLIYQINIVVCGEIPREASVNLLFEILGRVVMATA
jgi:hypothetical protein